MNLPTTELKGQMPSDTVYVRLSDALKAQLAAFVEHHSEYPNQSTAAAAALRLGLRYEELQQKLAEEQATINSLRYERMRIQQFAQGVNGMVQMLANQRRDIDTATVSTLAHQVGALTAMIGQPLKPEDDAGI